MLLDSNWTFPWRLPLGLSRKEVKHTRDHTAERSRATLFYSKRGKKGGGGGGEAFGISLNQSASTHEVCNLGEII